MNRRWSGRMDMGMRYIGTIGDCDLYVDTDMHGAGYAMVIHGDGDNDWALGNTAEGATRYVRSKQRDAMRVALVLAGVKP